MKLFKRLGRRRTTSASDTLAALDQTTLAIINQTTNQLQSGMSK